MNTVAIVGASGYIGRHLVLALASDPDVRVKVLTRHLAESSVSAVWPDNVIVVRGDMCEESSLQRLLEPACTVVNLAYLWDGGDSGNMAATQSLLNACKDMQVKRLVHCSTAAVVGRVAENMVTEHTTCRPVTEYGVVKLKIEQEMIRQSKGLFDSVILRPTGVYGPGGEPLTKLANDLVNAHRLKNYLRCCLFGRRRMNLVHISNVVAATLFLIRRATRMEGEIFIVSDDQYVSNNFASVERVFSQLLQCKPYWLPPIPLPLAILGLLLQCMGRNNINPRCNYAQGKLESIGFRSPTSFDDGLADYARWYKMTYLAARGEVVN